MRPLFTSVATAAPDHDLVTLDDLREQLRVKPNDTANDAWLSKVISRTSRQAERFCNRIFVVQTYVDTFSGNASGEVGEPLVLDQAPVDPASLTITVDAVALDPAIDFGLEQYTGLVYRLTDPAYWTSSSSLVAQYVAGFNPIPDDVQQAILELCTIETSGRGRDPMLRANESPGLGRQEYWVGGLPGGATIPQDIAGLLYPYRRILIG